MTNRSIIESITRKAQKEIADKTGMQVALIPKFTRSASYLGVLGILNEMCEQWNITTEWLQQRNKKENRPMMRKIFWLAAKSQYPNCSHAIISLMAGAGDHVTSIKGLRTAKTWLEVKDDLFMRYYEPVRHIVERVPVETSGVYEDFTN